MSGRQIRRKVARPQRVCAVHRAGGEIGGPWRAVVVAANGKPSVLAHSTFRDAAEVAEFAREHKADLLLGVAPGGHSVCRVVPLPDDATAETYSLLVETQFEESIPSHRRAGGLVPGRAGEPPSALLTAWGGRDDGDLTGLEADAWISEVAALASLGPGVSIAADRGQESVAVVATGGHKAVARVLRCDGSSDQAWRSSVAEAVEETAEAAGLRPPEIASSQDSLVVAGSPIGDRVAGARAESAWLNQFGVAVGAALVAIDADERVRMLATLNREAQDERASAIETIGSWLGSRRNALTVASACLVLMLLIPLGAAWGRTLLLEARAEALREQEAQWRELSDRAEMYRILTEDRWPMTKLLADLSRLTPVGVEVEQVTLSPEQGVVLRGTAESAELMNEFSRNLNGSGVFGLAMPGRQDQTQGSRVQFDLTASVMSPHARLAEAEDFAEQTLAVRLYGERGDNTIYSGGVSSRPSRSASRLTTRRPERSESTGGSESGGSTSAPEIPEPLTQSALDAMSRVDVMRSLPKWRSAIRNAPDDATRARLEGELRMIQAKLRESRGGDG
jgi:Tfp pilus assembly protein PilN